MILSKIRDPRLVTLRRGGTLTDSDHRLLALWAAACAEHVLDFFESARPEDPRPRQAIEHARAWVEGEVKMTHARKAAGHAQAAARELRGAARHAAYAAGQAAVVPHVGAREPPAGRPTRRRRPRGASCEGPAECRGVGGTPRAAALSPDVRQRAALKCRSAADDNGRAQ